MKRFVLEVKSRNIPDYLFMQYSLKIRSLDWYNLYWKSDKRISRICEMVQQMINYDTKRKQSNRGYVNVLMAVEIKICRCTFRTMKFACINSKIVSNSLKI
jgi:hypothetical protein